MSGHQRQLLALASTALWLVTACGHEEGERMCLGTNSACVTDGTLTTQTEVTTSSHQFNCSLVSDVAAAVSGEVYGVSVQAQGDFKPPLTITSGAAVEGGFYSAMKIFGLNRNSGTSSITKTGGVVLRDADNRTASCSTSVRILPLGNASGLGCYISASNQSVLPGQRVDFTFHGTGGNGTYSFSGFSPAGGTAIADSNITQPVTAVPYGRSSYIYTNVAIRMASVIVKSGSDEAVCRTPIFVGVGYPADWDSGWNWNTLPPWWYGGPFPVSPFPTSVNSCNLTLTTSPGLAGTLTKLNVTVPSSVLGGPWQIASVTATNLSTGLVSKLDDLPAIPRPSSLERMIRLRDAGQHRVRVSYRNSANTVTGQCETLQFVRAANQYITSTSTNVSSYNGLPAVRVFQDMPSYAVGGGHALPDLGHTGARVAMGDVNGDGFADLIIGGGPDNSGAITHRVVVRSGANPSLILHDFDPLPSHGGAGGVYVAAADVNADGKSDIIVGQEAPGSWIKIYRGGSSGLAPTFHAGLQPYGAVTHGVRVAGGDVNGDGYSDMIVAPAKDGGWSYVKAYDGRNLTSTQTTLHAFYAHSSTGSWTLAPTSGVHIGAGDVDGDGRADILVGASSKIGTDANYRAEVWAYSGLNGAAMAYKPVPYGSAFTGGIRVSAGDLNGDGVAEVLVAPGLGVPADGVPTVRAFNMLSNFQIASGFPFLEPYSAPFTPYYEGFFIGGGTGGL